MRAHEMNSVEFCAFCGVALVDLVNYGDTGCYPTVSGARFAAEREAWADALVADVMAKIAETSI